LSIADHTRDNQNRQNNDSTPPHRNKQIAAPAFAFVSASHAQIVTPTLRFSHSHQQLDRLVEYLPRGKFIV
jgi:hypothetical protein